jgi:hypothetical protein
MQLSKKDTRQIAYRRRADSARTWARLMIPVTFIVTGTAVWQDPQIGPKLEGGLEVVRPMAARYLTDTPLENILGPVPQDDVVEAGAEEGQLTVASNLPETRLPVNRP